LVTPRSSNAPVAALGVLVRAFRQITLVTGRRQLRWIAWGTALGVVPFGFGYALPWLFGVNPPIELQLTAVLLAVVPLALVVPAQAPYSNMAEFLAALKTTKLTFASAGTGTPGHFAGELLKAKTKANLAHVPYKGAGPALNDLIGNHVDLYFPGTPAALPLVKSKLVKMLAVSSAKRSGIAPDVPTVAETAGFKDFDFTLWAGVFAPRGTPPGIIAKLNTEIKKVLNDPETKKKLVDAGAEVDPMSVTQFRGFVDAESGKYLRIIKETGVTAD